MPRIELTEQQSQEVWGTIFGIVAFLSGIALWGNLGQAGEVAKSGLMTVFGLGAYAMPMFFAALAVSFFLTHKWGMNFTRIIGIFLLLVGGLGVLHVALVPVEEAMVALQAGGGFFGAAGGYPAQVYLGSVGAIVLLTGIAILGMIMTFPVSISMLFEAIFGFFPLLLPKPAKSVKTAKPKEEGATGKLTPADVNIENERLARIERDRKEAERRREEMRRAQSQKEESKTDKPLVATVGEWEFPPLSLLSNERHQITTVQKELDKKEDLIIQKLAEFGIGATKGPANTGPTVTQFTITPNEGVKLAKITSLKNDIALALSTPSLRLEAPIPGKDLIGIEIPNEKRTTVHLKEILESSPFGKIKSSLRLALGINVSNEAVVADLADMPHLLIAGATGAGKSVAMNAFLMSLLFQNSPTDLKLILVDPKRVELSPYNGIPHLLTPVITEADKALAALRWAVAEMMRRYGELANKGYRSVLEYNKNEDEKMPKIVVVVDELADLMMRQFKKDTEAAICRLAQMARAVGMHLIIATQRPSVDVITGLIKANIPTRIAFAVTSAIDSRTILDSVGAEDLLGKGDMLFSNASLAKPVRIQGIFVSGEEINRVINRLKLSGQPEYDDSITAGAEESEDFGGLPEFASSSGGDINQQAIEVIRQSRKASASLLQRRLSVGYARAARILDELEEQGLIGPARGAKPREIYL
jgi:S-DNA-T family DNA segregation ATPase FtsK/SpoIIIE